MEWTDEKALELIEAYRKHPILWDPTNQGFKLTRKKLDEWKELSEEIKVSVDESKRKIESLLTSYRRERQREGTSYGLGKDEVYHSKWFAFQAMQFLHDKFKPRKPSKTTCMTHLQSSIHDSESEGDVSPSPSIESEANRPEMIGIMGNNNVPENIGLAELHSLETPVQFAKRRRFSQKRQLPSELPLQGDTRLDEAYMLIKTLAERKTDQSEDSIFGQYVASQLKKFDPRVKVLVKHQINNILFEAEMGTLQQNSMDPLRNHSRSNDAIPPPTAARMSPIPVTTEILKIEPHSSLHMEQFL
ncbi:transcription factor Adf-1-like [Hylaeus anthracinus]|uniref:transcription factor Adf-1-like n=1 Tax=Hylaeus anthracinus TaxID=313031 RepID=UPI0023B99903|nr:transcription factor Adf-1-like [Hylaeus anthracinus]